MHWPLHWRLRAVLWLLSAAAIAALGWAGGWPLALPSAATLILFLALVGEPMVGAVRRLTDAGAPGTPMPVHNGAVATAEAAPAPGADLARALAEGQLVVLFRPVRRLADGACAGTEAELRWRHPLRGLLPAEDWPEPIPGELGNALLDLWLQAACAQARRADDGGLDLPPWPTEPLDAPVTLPDSVPASLWLRLGPVWLGMPELESRLLQALADSGLPAASLRLRIAPVRVGRTARLPDVATRLQAQGMAIVADGFGDGRPASAALDGDDADATVLRLVEGTGRRDDADARAGFDRAEPLPSGSASLAHLGQLPVQAVCLDRSIVERASHGVAPRLVVESTARVAASLGMTTLADGVGSRDQGLDLARLGCQFGVGEGCGPWREAGEWHRRRQARTVVGTA